MCTEKAITLFTRKENESHREYAYRVLRDNIMTMKLSPGSILNEADLADLLQVSRTPIHEAITKLSDEYLIDVYPRKASIVSKINLANFREGYFLRLTIEPIIIKQLEGSLSDENSKRILHNLNQQKEVIDTTGDANEFLKLDNDFHKLIYTIASRPLVWTAVRSVNGHFDRVRYMDTIINQADLSDIYQEHKWLYHTLLTGMLPDAEIKQFYEGHLGKLWKNFYGLLEKYPEYFDQ